MDSVLSLTQRLSCGTPDGRIGGLERADQRFERRAITNLGQRIHGRLAHILVLVGQQITPWASGRSALFTA